MNVFTITGYSYQADIWCPACIETSASNQGVSAASAEIMLDEWAEAWDIDRQDEYSFDSSEGARAFPKVIFGLDDDDLECGECGNGLGY